MAGTLTQLEDVSAGDWIAPRLAPFGTSVISVVPGGFEAYARIFHPVEGSQDGGHDEDRVTWRAVTEATGTVWHPLMQFRAVSGLGVDGTAFREPHWRGGEPREGALAGDELARLADVLAAHTGTPDDCFAGLWEGGGTIDGQGVGFFIAVGSAPWYRIPVVRRIALHRASRRLRREYLARGEFVHDEYGTRLRLPSRDYLLFTGPLAVFEDPDWAERFHWEEGPNLLWPSDRAWCLASEIDVDSTLVGGSQELVDAIVARPGLEAAQVPPDGALTYDADTVNPGPPALD